MGMVKRKEALLISIRISFYQGEDEAGHVYLYIMTNDLNKRPFGFIEDLFVENWARGLGCGKKLMEELEKEAEKKDCYKIVGCFRNSKTGLIKFYKSLGYDCEYGREFRKDL
ncbi:MAG: GNAT family N-acetyltransferase [Candidatus Magasanikbacteria bacterium]|nr:GNAT family N-acetyltransferase [Candidatus Magasanikbacteria bacterium]